MDGLFHIYRRAVSGEGLLKLSAEDSLHLVEALWYINYYYIEPTQPPPHQQPHPPPPPTQPAPSLSLAYNVVICWIYSHFYSCSMVITELPPDHAKKALEALCLPVVAPLQVDYSSGFTYLLVITSLLQIFKAHTFYEQEVINQGQETLEKKPARELTVHIDRVAYIFRLAESFSFISLSIPSIFFM